MSMSSGNTNATLNTLVGWVNSDSSRGTWDIIQTSLLTIFICTWTAIHPRIHPENRIARWHKALVLFKMILAPELVCLESIQEWSQAKKMRQRTALRSGGELKLVHAFYIGMLGVRYRTENGHRVLWPGQYTWLLNNGLVSWKERYAWGLSEESIRDKNKADGLVKLATLCQVIWFTFQCVTRAASNWTIAPLETMTLAYVLVAVITYIFWWHKPKDVATVALIDLPEMAQAQRRIFETLTMEDTYDVDDPQIKKSKNIAWYLVARECKDSDIFTPSNMDLCMRATLHYGVTAATGLEVPPQNLHSQETKADVRHASVVEALETSLDIEAPGADAHENSKIVTQWDDGLYMCRWWPLICLLGGAFGATHLISWNSPFPTRWELWLWRASALASIISSSIVMQFRAVTLEWDGPIALIRIVSPVIYLISRVVLVVQSFAALRLMPLSTYETFDLWSYWLHLF